MKNEVVPLYLLIKEQVTEHNRKREALIRQGDVGFFSLPVRRAFFEIQVLFSKLIVLPLVVIASVTASIVYAVFVPVAVVAAPVPIFLLRLILQVFSSLSQLYYSIACIFWGELVFYLSQLVLVR